MARISRAGVEHVAALARLSLSDAESDRMASELDRILEYANALAEIDTTGVEPTSHAVLRSTPLRADDAATPLDPRIAVANAPSHEGSAFVVPKVIDDDPEG